MTMPGWGDPEEWDDPEGGSAIQGINALAGGHWMHLNEEAFHELLRHPAVRAAVTARANQICDAANSMVGLDPRAVARLSETQEGPAYKVTVPNNPASTRARAYVRPNGMLGKLDNAENLTLMKAVDQYPSDPEASAPADFWDGYGEESIGGPVAIEEGEEA